MMWEDAFGCVFKLNNYLHDDIFLLSLLKNMGFLGLIFVPHLDFAPHLVWNNFVDTDVCLQSLQCKPPKNDAFSSTILWLIQHKLRYAVSCYRCSWVLIALFVEESFGLSLQTVLSSLYDNLDNCLHRL